MNPENVIVTLRDGAGHYAADYELPANAPLQEYEILLLEELAYQAGHCFGGWRGLYLVTEAGEEIRGNDSLAAHGVWDGGILTVVRGK